jgi:hypothetical protein
MRERLEGVVHGEVAVRVHSALTRSGSGADAENDQGLVGRRGRGTRPRAARGPRALRTSRGDGRQRGGLPSPRSMAAREQAFTPASQLQKCRFLHTFERASVYPMKPTDSCLAAEGREARGR